MTANTVEKTAPEVAINDIGSQEDILAAIDAVTRGETGVMTALRGEDVVLVPLAEIAGKVKQVPNELLDVARALA